MRDLIFFVLGALTVITVKGLYEVAWLVADYAKMKRGDRLAKGRLNARYGKHYQRKERKTK